MVSSCALRTNYNTDKSISVCRNVARMTEDLAQNEVVSSLFGREDYPEIG